MTGGETAHAHGSLYFYVMRPHGTERLEARLQSACYVYFYLAR